MSQHYFNTSDDLPNATASFVDEDAGWWVGVQQCGAYLALAAFLTAGAAQAAVATQVFSFHQDDPALTAGYMDEQSWTNPVAPVPYYVPPQLFTDDQVIVPQPPQGIADDNELWQNPVAPYVAATIVPSPAVDEQTPFLFGVPDDNEIWQPLILAYVAPNFVPPPWLFEQADIVPQPVVGVQNYVNTGANNFISQEIGFGTEF